MVGQTLNVNGHSMGRCDVYHMLPTHHVYINGLDWLTSRSTVLLKKLIFSASHEMPTFYGNCKFVTALLVPILSQIHPLHVPPPQPPISVRFIVISSSHLSQGVPSGLVPRLRFPHQLPACISSFPPYMSHAPSISFFFLF